MDRHRRQFTLRPFSAAHSGVFRHFPNMFNAIMPVHTRTSLSHVCCRSLSWNS
ncbi:protein YoaL [Kosakonia radicincitans]|uniref:protein YoaL n=1 Tax=Kosakonia radicincitans TaxID=283686 RepID=UPI00386403A3